MRADFQDVDGTDSTCTASPGNSRMRRLGAVSAMAACVAAGFLITVPTVRSADDPGNGDLVCYADGAAEAVGFSLASRPSDAKAINGKGADEPTDEGQTFSSDDPFGNDQLFVAAAGGCACNFGGDCCGGFCVCEPGCAGTFCNPICNPGNALCNPICGGNPCNLGCSPGPCGAGCGDECSIVLCPQNHCNANCNAQPQCDILCGGNICGSGCPDQCSIPLCPQNHCSATCTPQPQCDALCGGNICGPGCPDRCNPVLCPGNAVCDPTCGGNTCNVGCNPGPCGAGCQDECSLIRNSSAVCNESVG